VLGHLTCLIDIADSYWGRSTVTF